MSNSPESVSPAARRSWRAWAVPALAVLFAAVAAIGWWLRDGRTASAEEVAARAELTKLGALVVMDAGRTHVAGVTLSTIQSPDRLERAIQLLPSLTHINSLNAEQTPVGDEQARVIGGLSSLQDLVLSHTGISDAAVKSLAGLSNLRSLHLANTGLTNAAIPELTRLTSLTILDISGTKVTGNFETLPNLTKLNWLVVRGLPLEGEAIAAVANCPNLHRLSLTAAGSDPEALAKLEQQRPELAIDR